MNATPHTRGGAILPTVLLALGLIGTAAAAPQFSARQAAPQNVGTSAITAAAPALLNPGVSTTLCFTANINSPDAEYTDRVDVDLPDGWTLGAVSANSTPVANGCAAALPPVSGTAAGNVVFWQSAGAVPTGCGAWNGSVAGTNFQFCVEVTPPDCSGAPWDIPWSLTGDGWGAAPHSASGTFSAVGCGLPPPTPNIDVSPAALASTQATDTTTSQTLTIANSGAADLIWTIDEEPVPRSPVTLALPGKNGPAAVTAAIALELDDGTVENNIGIGGTQQFIFLNRFTPAVADFPITLDEVQVYFGSSGLANVGDDMLLVLYENTTGGSDPAPGSSPLATYPVTVATLDAWNSYTLPAPVTFSGPGDVLIGVIALETPGTSYFPAALDQTAPQQRSWAGWWTATTAPMPPVLPPDDTWTLIDAYFPGNWMVRGYGTGADPACAAPASVPWLSVSPASGTTAAGTSTPVTVTFDATGLAAGSYTANLCVRSDDPDAGPGNGTDLVVVPVSLTVTAPVTHTVTSSVGTPSGAIAPLGAQTVLDGDAITFTLTPDAGHHIDSVGGTCGGTLTGTSYTTSAVTADCTVIAHFAVTPPVTHTVTSSVGTPSGAIAPLGAQTVLDGDAITFTLTPDAGHHIDSVGGTCGGTLTGTSYTTSAVTVDCTVIANFAVDLIAVTTVVPAGHGTISGPATVAYGATATYALTPDAGYGIGSVTGCGGTLAGNVYTTGPITGPCTITVSFALLGGPAPTLVPASGWQMLLLMMGLLLGGAFITLRRGS